MENDSQIGTYVAYFFVFRFLLVVAVAAARSYGMIMSLVLMVFTGNTKPSVNADVATTDESERDDVN